MPSLVWAQHDTEAWAPAVVVEETKKRIIVRHEDGTTLKMLGSLDKHDLVNMRDLSIDYDDMCLMESICEGSVLRQIKDRYFNDKIYTWVGTALVALNPYKFINFYSEDNMGHIFSEVKKGSEGNPGPHIFTVAATMLNNVEAGHMSQALIISGESGAGKTETTKKALSFVATMASGRYDQIAFLCHFSRSHYHSLP